MIAKSRRWYLLLLIISQFNSPLVFAHNAELFELFSEDQAARSGDSIDWDSVREDDLLRRYRVLELFQEGKVVTSQDYFFSALIYQHGSSLEEIQLALSFAIFGLTNDPSNRNLQWIRASSLDRLLLLHDNPQWYGTQYIKTENGGVELDRIDESIITDEERLRIGLPTLEQAKSRVGQQ